MEERELPVGWEIVKLGQIAAIFSGNGFPKEHQGRTSGDLGFFKVSDISRSIAEGQSRLCEARNYISVELASELKATIIPGGSTVFAKIGEAIGLNRRAITEIPCIVDNNVMAVKAVGEIRDMYVFYFLRSQDFRELARATTVPSLRKSDISDLRFPVPPLNEQRRIAAKLDTTLAAVDACRQRLDGVADLLKRFRHAVLAAATSGELTREWREERGLGHEPFKKYSLKDLVQEPLRNGKSVRDGDGDYVLRLSCLKSDSIDWAESKRGSWEGIAVERFLIQKGDFLVARGNGSKSLVGRGCLVDEPPLRVAFPDTMIRIRPDQSKIHPVYLSIAWEHRSTRNQIESFARTSAGIWKVAQSDLEVIRLLVPCYYEEQVEVVRRAQELFTLADQLEARLTSARKVVDRLTPALLAKAFRGELVPQDPEDEPASVLLERIRAARQAEAGEGKPSRRGRPKAAAHPAPINRNAAPAPSDSLPPDVLACLLRECGPLSERALLAASDLAPERFQRQLATEIDAGGIREELEEGEKVLVLGG
jgi:type I restriction enzyme S subunit